MLSPVTPVPENLPDLFVPESLRWAHPLVQEWFVRRFSTPTEPQEQGWPRDSRGETGADLRADWVG